MRRTRTALVGGALLLPLALAACNSPKPTVAAGTATPVSAAPAAGIPSEIPSLSGKAPASPAKPNSAPAQKATSCTGTDFQVDFNLQDELGLGSTRALVALTNKSSHACTLNGYPGVTLLGADNKPITAPSRNVDQPGTPEPVVVPPGSTAFAGIKWAGCDESDTSCAVPTSIQVTPPGLSGAVFVNVTDVHAGKPLKYDIGSIQIGTVQESTQGVVAW